MIGRFPYCVEGASRVLHGAMEIRPHLRHRPVMVEHPDNKTQSKTSVIDEWIDVMFL